MLPPAIVIGGVAGGVYLLSRQNATALPPGPTSYNSPSAGSTYNNILTGSSDGAGGYYDPTVSDAGQAAYNTDGRLADPDARAKLDALDSAMQSAYNGMAAGAKSAAADQLNQSLSLSPPLTGNETWEQVARVAGGAAGVAGCNLIPGIGTAVSPLCGLAGAYLGVKLEDWMATALPDIQSWVTQSFPNAVQSVVDDVGNWFQNLF